MDTVVHGAWLRNSQVSQQRPAAQTDDLVYDLSRQQLFALTAKGNRPIRVHMYQTGFEPAVVGFYRALTDHLLEFPRSVAVQPMYYQQSAKSSRTGRSRQHSGIQRSQGSQGADRGARPRQSRNRDTVSFPARTLPRGNSMADVAAVHPQRGRSSSQMREFVCKDCQREAVALQREIDSWQADKSTRSRQCASRHRHTAPTRRSQVAPSRSDLQR